MLKKDKELMRSCVDLSELIYAIGKRKKTEENETLILMLIR